MQNFKRLSAWTPLVAGLGVLVLASRAGGSAIFLAAVPGALMIAGGGRSLLFPDMRAPQQSAIGSILGILLALPIGLAGGVAPGLVTLALSVLALFAAGWLQIRLQPEIDEVPAPKPTAGYSLLVAADGAMLGMMSFLTPGLTPAGLRESVRESEAAYELLLERGYIEEPWKFHAKPPGIESPDLRPVHVCGFDCEKLNFESGFEPDSQLPGRDRWLSYSENRTSHALVLRHRQPGPWLVCVHGFGMGANVKQDFRAFRAAQLHERAGLNVALFTMPVHGPRSPGGFNGKQFFGISVGDFLHAETQAIWDLRRLIAWIRSQGATQVGVHGISLGGYTSAVLSCVEDDLACVIAGVPPTDMIAQLESAAGTYEQRLSAVAGVDFKRDRAVYSVVSPLVLSSRVPQERRFIYAATGDQFVPIEQVHALWLHWERPRISWCTGGHASALMQRKPRELVDEAINLSF